MSVPNLSHLSDAQLRERYDALRKKHPELKLNPDQELIAEILGEELGKVDKRINGLEQDIKPRIMFEAFGRRMGKEVRTITDATGELLTRIEALEQGLDARQSLVLSVREMRIELEATVSGLRHELDAMKAENDILRQCLSPKDKITAKDAVSMLRSIR